MKKTTAAIAVLTLLIAAPVNAQAGMFFGAHATGASLTNQSATDPVEFGSGYGVHAGLWFGRSFGVLAIHDKTIPGAKTEDVDLGQWDLLGRWSFIKVGPATAFLTAGFSKHAATSFFNDDGRGDLPFKGIRPTAGLTGQLPVTSRLAVDAGLLWTLVSFTDNHGQSASRLDRLTLGVSYYLFGGRKAVRSER